MNFTFTLPCSVLSLLSLSLTHTHTHTHTLSLSLSFTYRPCRGPAAGLFSRRAMFNPRSVHLRFAVDKVLLGQPCPRVFRFCPVSVIPPMLRTHLIHMLLLPGHSGEAWELSKKQHSLGNRGTLDRTVLPLSHL